MAATFGGLQGFNGSLYGQTQMLQAQRVADQAEQNARTLRQRSADAQRAAAQAQETARSLKVRADQADGDARTAQQQVAGLHSAQSSGQRLGQVYGRAAAADGGAAGRPGKGAAISVKDIAGAATKGTVVNTTA